MIDILQLIPHNSKKSPGGWWTFNAPCCVHRGESRDTRKRGGVITDGNDWSFHCFNCNFKARFVMGQLIGKNAKLFLTWMGVDEKTIQKMNLDSIRNKGFRDVVRDRERSQIITKNIQFDKFTLPPGSRPITLSDTVYVDYLKGRGLDIGDYSFRITPEIKGRNKNRIIMPYKYGGDVVGWTSRYFDNNKPKYFNEHQQVGYVFGTDLQDTEWEYAIVAEGIIDAISMNGLAVLHNDITHEQMTLLRKLGREIIVVIDQDKSGLYLAEIAMKHGFSVSVPNWGLDENKKPIHDINEAVQKYGKTATLLSIINARESNKIKITVALNNMKKRMKIHDS